MSPRKPPALANWLLTRFRIADTNPPLAGDLLEEFQSGRSRAWYWRQTVKAITTTLGHNARSRLPGILLGWAIQASIACAFWRLYSPDIPLHVLIPVIMIAISNLMIAGMILGVQRMNKLGHVLDPMGTRFIPLAVIVGLILGTDGDMQWRAFVVLACLWLVGLVVYSALRPPGSGARLQVAGGNQPKQSPPPRGILGGLWYRWFFQQAVANTLWRHNLPAQMPLRFLVSGALVILSALLIVRLAMGIPARKKLLSVLYRRVVLDPAVRMMVYLAVYCLIALCAPLSMVEFLVLECVWLLQEWLLLTLLPSKGTTK